MRLDSNMTEQAKLFSQYCKELNRSCFEAQSGERETVSDEEARYATKVVKQAHISTPGDLLVYSAAMNLLKTCVKQPGNKKFGYWFKGRTDAIVKYLLENDLSEIRMDLQEDKGMSCLVVEICGIQCSFHQVPGNGIFEKLKRKCDACGYDHIEWDEIRKQRCASTFFAGALNNPFRAA